MFEVKQYRNNELVPMTRRYPKLRQKVLIRDSKISERIIRAWDIEKSQAKVLDIFLKERDLLSDERYWEILRSVWIICGSVENSDIFRNLMKSGRPQKHYFSTPEEIKKLIEMTEYISVYRATNDSKDGGLSWTLSKPYAQQYADDYYKCMIVEREVNKKDIFAFIERNNESEIIIL